MKKFSFNKEQFKKNAHRWFTFNYHKIGIYITLIGTVLLTTTMPLHIRSVYLLLSELSAFYMFMLMILATILIFAAISFSKHKSPFVLFIFTFATGLNTYFAYKYLFDIFYEISTRDNLTMQSYMSQSIMFVILGSIFMILATIYNWIIVDWKYVKEVE